MAHDESAPPAVLRDADSPIDLDLDRATVETPVGPFTILSADDVVLCAGFTPDQDRLLDLINPALRPSRPLRAIRGGPNVAAVERYLSGDLGALDDVTLRWAGSPFHQRAWAVMRQVPPGSVISYGELAQRAGADGWEGARAAGQACARNPISLFVP